MKGKVFVISGPSGVGKGTVVNEILKGSENIILSVSATTRKPREGEREGINYYYKTQDEFQRMIDNNELIEWARFCDNYYGTPKAPVMDVLNQGKNILLEIEIQGAMNVKKNFPESVLLFILPPSLEELEKRLKGRGTESSELIKLRVDRAKEELLFADNYDYKIVNNTVEDTVEEIKEIIRTEQMKG